jgi:phosphoserine aminotransferase
MVIVRDDMLKRVPANLPAMLKYTTYTSKNSLYNTPPTFAIYTVQLVLKWLEETVGGLGRMEALNRQKAGWSTVASTTAAASTAARPNPGAAP